MCDLSETAKRELTEFCAAHGFKLQTQDQMGNDDNMEDSYLNGGVDGGLSSAQPAQDKGSSISTKKKAKDKEPRTSLIMLTNILEEKHCKLHKYLLALENILHLILNIACV
jgi:hypothetical protein